MPTAPGLRPAADRQRRQVGRNHAAFMAMLPDLQKTDAGRFALLRDGNLVICLDTFRGAVAAGRRMFGDGVFPVQEITAQPVDLGWLFRFTIPESI